ncbi:MAG: MBOAT family protein [Clostridia bacterium]|nr:MBOAT family protein [Clostridia bacterium]
MQLVSLEFFTLLATSLLLYNVTPRKWRWTVLLMASLVFYLCAGVFAFIYIIVASLSSYALALKLQKHQKEGGGFAPRLVFYIGILALLSAWVILKLLSSHREGILPLGISFYSLRIISYLVDTKRQRVIPERNFFKYLLFVSYFPLILQGPVVRYAELSDSLYAGKRASSEERVSGLILLLWGVAKKVVVANTLAAPLATVADESGRYSGAFVLFLLCFYSAEIYCDFSGGIDIVRGASFMLGIALPRNFDRPFSSTSLREFWNRWHISLGEWFEHYVFYPLSLSRPMQKISKRARKMLGGKRGRKIPLYIATMTTWLLTGLWHGFAANYIAWGLINGGLVLLSLELSPLCEKIYTRHPNLKERKLLINLFGKLRVFFIIGAVRLLDVYGSVTLTFKMLVTPFYDLASYTRIFAELPSLIPVPELCAVMLALFAVLLVGKNKVKAWEIAKSPTLAAATVLVLAIVPILFGKYGMGFDAGEFIYSRF